MKTGRFLKLEGKKELVNTVAIDEKAMGSISLVRRVKDGSYYLVSDNYTTGVTAAIAFINEDEAEEFKREIEAGETTRADLRIQLQH